MDMRRVRRLCTERMTLVLVQVIHAAILFCRGLRLERMVSFFRMESRYVSNSRAVQILE